MNRQKSFHNTNSTLYLVATPIGNRQELTPRAIEILKNVSLIACEDTRTSRNLLDSFAIDTRTVAYHNFNEENSAKGLIEVLLEGNDVALISDAGYPLVSDPGYEIVSQCIENDINVVPISGANAALDALVASGLPANHYLFYGFLNAKASAATRELEELKYYPFTMIFYESPHRLSKTIALLNEILGDRRVCIARELTKQYEEFIRGRLSEMGDLEELKGEIVIVIEGYHKEEKAVSFGSVNEKIEEYIEAGMSVKDAINAAARDYNLPRNKVYREYHKIN